jgi:RHS repeat-associated protein
VQITDHAGGGAVYLPARDANGNITALIDAGATAPGANPVAASYEYSPFGELLRVEGPYAAANPFRFSSKFTDDETGLVCYGLRYYNPALGRFLNRDPIGEAGGENLYAFVGNGPVNRLDVLGANPFATFWAWLTGSGKPTAADGRDGGGGGALTVYVGSDDDLGFNVLGDAIESGAVFQHGGLTDAAARQQEAGTRRRYADWNVSDSRPSEYVGLVKKYGDYPGLGTAMSYADYSGGSADDYLPFGAWLGQTNREIEAAGRAGEYGRVLGLGARTSFRLVGDIISRYGADAAEAVGLFAMLPLGPTVEKAGTQTFYRVMSAAEAKTVTRARGLVLRGGESFVTQDLAYHRVAGRQRRGGCARADHGPRRRRRGLPSGPGR